MRQPKLAVRDAYGLIREDTLVEHEEAARGRDAVCDLFRCCGAETDEIPFLVGFDEGIAGMVRNAAVHPEPQRKSGDALHVFFGPDIVPERHQESTLADIWLRLPQHACRAVQFREMDVPYLNAMMGRAEVVFDDMRA